MARGCDYAWERPDPRALAAAGYTFVCRYLSYDSTGKNLTADEVKALHSAGLSIVLNWEYSPRAALTGYLAGVKDGQEAWRQARALGAPLSTPIYFSMDWDVQPSEVASVYAYLSGVAQTVPWQVTGVYGGYRAIDAVSQLTPKPWLWQTYAWSGGQWHPAANVRQVRNGVPFAGLRIDEDESMTVDFGQWRPSTVDTVGGTVSQYEPQPAEVVNLITQGSDNRGYVASLSTTDTEVNPYPEVAAYNLKALSDKLDKVLAAVQALQGKGSFTLSGSATLSGGGTLTPSA